MAFASVTQVSCRFRQSLHLHPYLVRMLDDRQVRAAGLDDQGGLDAIEIVDGRVFHIALGCFPRRNLHASDRTSVVWGRRVYVRVDLGGSGLMKKKDSSITL